MILQAGKIKAMKTIKYLCGMLAVLAFTACSNSDEDVVIGNSHLCYVTIEASMDGANTRTLAEGEGNALTASFAVGEKVMVVDAEDYLIGTLTAQTAGASTTLAGAIDTEYLSAGEVVKLRYLNYEANYDGQDGTLDGIAAGQDYAEGTLTVSSKDPLTFTSNSVTLSSKQSITKFSFTDGSNPVSVKTFGIAASGLVQSIEINGEETVGAVTGTLSAASSDVYVALRNSSGKQTYSFYVSDASGNWYTGTKSANLANGKNYTANVALTQLPTLSASPAVGDVGVLNGQPAIVVEISSTKKAVALMNAGALCPEHYGGYYTFTDRASALSDGWYVPTKAELDALIGISNTWTAQYGVNGRQFTFGSNTLFLPAGGFKDNDNDNNNNDSKPDFGYAWVGDYGYYWSSDTSSDNLAYCLRFKDTATNTYSEYQVNALSVRPFHALP